jgi:hypothetical protein
MRITPYMLVNGGSEFKLPRETEMELCALEWTMFSFETCEAECVYGYGPWSLNVYHPDDDVRTDGLGHYNPGRCTHCGDTIRVWEWYLGSCSDPLHIACLDLKIGFQYAMDKDD